MVFGKPSSSQINFGAKQWKGFKRSVFRQCNFFQGFYLTSKWTYITARFAFLLLGTCNDVAETDMCAVLGEQIRRRKSERSKRRRCRTLQGSQIRQLTGRRSRTGSFFHDAARRQQRVGTTSSSASCAPSSAGTSVIGTGSWWDPAGSSSILLLIRLRISWCRPFQWNGCLLRIVTVGRYRWTCSWISQTGIISSQWHVMASLTSAAQEMGSHLQVGTKSLIPAIPKL